MDSNRNELEKGKKMNVEAISGEPGNTLEGYALFGLLLAAGWAIIVLAERYTKNKPYYWPWRRTRKEDVQNKPW